MPLNVCRRMDYFSILLARGFATNDILNFLQPRGRPRSRCPAYGPLVNPQGASQAVLKAFADLWGSIRIPLRSSRAACLISQTSLTHYPDSRLSAILPTRRGRVD